MSAGDGMTDLGTSSEPISRSRVRAKLTPSTVDVLVEHLHYFCLSSRDSLLIRPSTGMVLCECGSAGWIVE